MKRFAIILSLSAAISTAAICPVGVQAQEDPGFAAKAALINVANRYGADSVQWIVELRAFFGQAQPKEWEIVVYDPNARHLVHEYWAGENGDVSDEGPSPDFYPKRSPTGFIQLSDLKLDSKAAFTVAEGEARKAKMGFNSLNYFLRAREYSREPIWTLELLDIDENLAGKIYISGSTGEVLRTVWFYRGDQGNPDGSVRMIDSATPRPGGDPGLTTTTSDSNLDPRNQRPSTNSTGDEPDPFGRKMPVPSDAPDGTRIPVPPAPPAPSSSGGSLPGPPIPPAPSSGGGVIDTKIPPPPVPQN